MSLSQLLFLLVFFPAVILLYQIIPVRARRYYLILASLGFYAWGGLRNLLLLLLLTLLNYLTALQFPLWRRSGKEKAARVSLIVTVALNVFSLGLFKYTGLAMPIGVSFYTFSLISYVADVFRGSTEAEKDPTYVILYVAFFPKIVSGPVVQYRDFRKQVADGCLAKPNLPGGLELFLVGLFKKVLLADALGLFLSRVTGASVINAGAAWMGALLFFLQLYFDFGGYSDMAIGLARIFGFRLEKNFNYPYLSASVSEFWGRWHISLGMWFRNYVYFPLGGSRCEKKKQVRNLWVVWLLTGIWHGSTLNFLVWGAWHGLFVCLEHFGLRARLETLPKAVRVLYTDLVVFFGWVFFFAPSLPAALRYLGSMFGIGTAGAVPHLGGFLFRESLPLLLVALLCCGPWLRNLYKNLFIRRGGAWRFLSVLIYAGLTVACVASLIGSTYSTFLYAQF